MALGTDGLAGSYAGPRDTTIPQRADTAWTGGVNWYLNDFARVQVNVVRERREAGVGLDRGVTWSRLLRLQFGF
jgi:phosphate-selective porin